jgi:hypothetical protein
MRIVVVVALAGWLAPGVALASPPPSDVDRATARSLAREGYEAQKRGDYGTAADRFTRAEQLVDAPTLLLGIGRAQVGLGKLVEAEETYQRILRERLEPDAPAPFVKALQDARVEAAALAPRLAWVTIDVQGAHGSSVSVDGEPVAAAGLGVRRPYDPGSHTLHVSADGFLPADQTFQVSEGETRTIAISPPTKLSSTPATVQSWTVEPTAGTPFGRTAGIAALSLGAAGLVAGGITGALVLAQHADLSRGCPDGQCPSSEAQDLARYHALADASTASLAIGASLVVTGAVLLLATHGRTSVNAYAGFLRAGIGGTF